MDIKEIKKEISETKRFQREYVPGSIQYERAEKSIKDLNKLLKKVKK